MSIKDLAVQIDHTPHCEPGLEVALALAERTGAHLSAIHVDPVSLSPELVAMSSAPVLLESLYDEQAQRAEESRKRFDARVAGQNYIGEWRAAQGPAFEALCVHARHADLLVITQDGDDDRGGAFAGLAETAVMECGRPVLVVPYIGAPAPLDGKILVAWNGTRQAARAANDAIPLMSLAKEVEVVAIHPSGTDLAGVPIPGADLCLHLARHGIDAQARTLHGDDIAAGDLLLSHVVDSGANMVVMGAYGHSRLRELVLGGMTRNILRHMTAPILMSH
jgi:nucleotide-binding universal stress UspA family protein